MHRSPSLLSFDEYKERESKSSLSTAVTPEGSLLDRTVLELRLNPPNVEIDNTSCETATIITVDSANRPGTLVEVRLAHARQTLSVSHCSAGRWGDKRATLVLSGGAVPD